MSNKPSSFERGWRILEYLRRNTDAEHPVRNLRALEADCEKSERAMLAYISREKKDTFKDTVWNVANALNSDVNGSVLPQDQWRVVYGAYLNQYGVTDQEVDDDPDWPEDEEDGRAKGAKPRKRRVSPVVEGLYYQHAFSYQEIDEIIESIMSSQPVDTGETNRLVRKIERNLTTKFYPRGPRSVCKVRETIPVNWDRLRENLLIIQQAIDKGVKISFRFNGYDRDRNLVPVRKERDVVSPYYCVAYGGRYYLLACQEKERETGPERRMSIWRVDLMTEMAFLKPEEKALAPEEVENLPRNWDGTFPFHHLNMSFDKPVDITLRIVNPWYGQDGGTWTNYTFLMDWFGGFFDYERTETEPPYGDIVRVTCSPWGMVNWALQYSDRVEVLEPQSVREQVAEKIRALNEKYGMMERMWESIHKE